MTPAEREQQRDQRLKRCRHLVEEMEKELAQHKSPKTVLVQMRRVPLLIFAARYPT